MNLAIAFSGLVIAVIGFFQVLFAYQLERQQKGILQVFFGVLIAYAASDIMAQLSTRPTAAGAQLARTGLFLESTFSSLLLLLVTGFLLYSLGELRWWKNRFFQVVTGIWGVYFALLVYTQFSTTIYYYTQENVYIRGPLYPVLLVPPVVIMVMDLALYLRRREELPPDQQKAFAAYLILPTVCMVIQMLFYGLYTILLGTAVGAMIMLAFILREQAQSYHLQVEKNAQLNTRIMMTQIQPHFIFNSLNVIRRIYRNDLQEGERALDQFSAYLRHNLESLTTEQPIPFDRELEHVRRYLELQQLRFGDELTVVYDLHCRDFRLPALTLQPLVENAVTYGVRQSETGIGTVTIRSREWDDRYEVSVEDNGEGFDPEAALADGKRTHIGLYNVRKRLKQMSKGSLRIDSAPGQGTTATEGGLQVLIFAIDDEKLILQDYESAIREAAPKAEVRAFTRGAAALKAVTEEGLRPELVFCDIEMPGMTGLTFAEHLRKVSPGSRVVFVTSYTEYALEAFRVRAQGYVLKPLTPERVREELEVWKELRAPETAPSKKLAVHCFGHFEVYLNGEPILFHRRQTKELMAFLIDREGASCTSEQIAAALWIDEGDMRSLMHRVRNLISDLKRTLESVGMEDVLIRERRQLAIRKDLIDCDYYRLLEGDEEALRSYRGEYMVDYSWAETTAGNLHFQYGPNEKSESDAGFS